MARNARSRSSRRTRKRSSSRRRRGGNPVLQAASVPLTLTVLNNVMKGKKVMGLVGGKRKKRRRKSRRKSRKRSRRRKRR